MCRILLSLMLLVAGLTATGAENEFPLSIPTSVDSVSSVDVRPAMSRNIFAEFFGPSFGVGIGFDSRFRAGSVFGYRVGLSFTSGSLSSDYDMRDLEFNGVCIPLEANAILGGGKSKFEVGLGIVPSVLKRRELTISGQWIWDDETGDIISTPDCNFRQVTRPNILGLINVGYRYQRTTGFFMRIGLTALIGSWDCSPIDGVIFLPNLSLGYTIRH
ncbi:hypothetical protein [uncultured Duncaniella sp.]|uniref:hypothetical protein n=1 Tax=uncultured Duncaniella sp. TaxID=2768039 RepID=UPI0025EBD05D|nr:hypothetical protein [uncultured Duncaniella sp.]